MTLRLVNSMSFALTLLRAMGDRRNTHRAARVDMFGLVFELDLAGANERVVEEGVRFLGEIASLQALDDASLTQARATTLASQLAVFAMLPLGFFVVGVTLASEAEEGAIKFPPPLTVPVAVAIALIMVDSRVVSAICTTSYRGFKRSEAAHCRW